MSPLEEARNFGLHLGLLRQGTAIPIVLVHRVLGNIPGTERQLGQLVHVVILFPYVQAKLLPQMQSIVSVSIDIFSVAVLLHVLES